MNDATVQIACWLIAGSSAAWLAQTWRSTGTRGATPLDWLAGWGGALLGGLLLAPLVRVLVVASGGGQPVEPLTEWFRIERLDWWSSITLAFVAALCAILIFRKLFLARSPSP